MCLIEGCSVSTYFAVRPKLTTFQAVIDVFVTAIIMTSSKPMLAEAGVSCSFQIMVDYIIHFLPLNKIPCAVKSCMNCTVTVWNVQSTQILNVPMYMCCEEMHELHCHSLECAINSDTQCSYVQFCSKRMGRRQIVSSRKTTVRLPDSWKPRFTRWHDEIL